MGVVAVREERPEGGHLIRLTIDNAKKLNTIGRALMVEIVETIERLEADRDLRLVILTGAGERAFVGGADITELAVLDRDTARDFITLVHRCCDGLRRLAVPVIARIDGYALGAGLELAAACDLRVASERAMFGMPEVRVGIPSVVEAALLARLCGPGRARWLVMTGETIDARQALDWGLIEKSVPASALDRSVDHALDCILAGGGEAIRAQKRLCRLWEEAPLAESIRASIDAFAASYESTEPRERVAAFRRARKPKR